MPEMRSVFAVSPHHPVFKMVLDGVFNLLGLLALCKVLWQVDDHFELRFCGEVFDDIDNVMLCGSIEFLFMEGGRIK